MWAERAFGVLFRVFIAIRGCAHGRETPYGFVVSAQEGRPPRSGGGQLMLGGECGCSRPSAVRGSLCLALRGVPL